MPRNIFTIIDGLVSGIEELKKALAPLSALAGAQRPTVAATAPTARAARPKRRRRGARVAKPAAKTTAAAPAKTAQKTKKKPVSAAIHQARVFQGKYMSATRGLNPAQKAQVRKARAEQGAEPALKLAASFGKSK
jgi:hypothetical protein